MTIYIKVKGKWVAYPKGTIVDPKGDAWPPGTRINRGGRHVDGKGNPVDPIKPLEPLPVDPDTGRPKPPPKK